MICLGRRFGSYSELKCAIQEYEKRNFVQFWTSHSRTIECAKKRGLRKDIKQELSYAEITYSCVQSGKYESQSKGFRKIRGTQRQGCEAKIRLKTSEDGQFLVVVVLNQEHNHELNKECTRGEASNTENITNDIQEIINSSVQEQTSDSDNDNFIVSTLDTPGDETVTIKTRRGRSLLKLIEAASTENSVSVPSCSKSNLTSSDEHVETDPETTLRGKRKRIEDQDNSCKKLSTDELIKVESNKVAMLKDIARALQRNNLVLEKSNFIRERKNLLLEKSNEIRERKLLIEKQRNSLLLRLSKSLEGNGNPLLGVLQKQE